jgi:hypothetical protein
MSRTVVEEIQGDVKHLAPEAPYIAQRLLKLYAPGLITYLVKDPTWHYGWTLHDAVHSGGAPNWGRWKKLLWALEMIGDIHARPHGYGVAVRISTDGWLRAVQRGAAQRSGDAVPV